MELLSGKALNIFAAILFAISMHASFARVPKPVAAELEYRAEPFYKYRKDGKPGRAVILILKGAPYTGTLTVTVKYRSVVEKTFFNHPDSLNQVMILLPAGAGVNSPADIDVNVTAGSTVFSKHIVIPAKKQWTVYIYPHSHVDIGYTALQDTVKKLHMRNIDIGIDIARKTQNYPEGARFTWNPEATWVVDNYLKTASAGQKREFIEAVQKGWLQIDGAHSNSNTSALSDEGLMHFFDNSRRIASVTGVPVTTMVQMDNPGGSWGLIQAAAQNGIKGFFSFPNFFDLRDTLTNKPFYWLSPDGKHKVFFLQAVSYGWGFRLKGMKYGLAKSQRFTSEYDRLSTPEPLKSFIDPFIFDETAKLENEGSPYDIFTMTWSMADNCLIDADLPEAVKQWNNIYAYPKLIIAGTKDIMAAYEKKYKDILPVLKGDYTEYWTEGLGSDARSVGMARRAQEDLVQAETLWSLFSPKKSSAVFQDAWENLLLAAEHTWGYQDPRAPLAKIIEAKKAAYFADAKKEADSLILEATMGSDATDRTPLTVYNTLSWPRDGLVSLSAGQSRDGDRVLNKYGKEMPAQRLSDGTLVFMAGKIPAMGSETFRIVKGRYSGSGGMSITNTALSNGLITVKLDERTGNIRSITDETGHEYADSSADGINSFIYLPGVYNGRSAPGKASTVTDVSLSVKENGPLVISVVAKSKAESCNWLTREVRLMKGQFGIEITNTLDKLPELKKEGIHFGYGFNIPDGTIKMDIPWGIMTPGKDQIPSANKNWFVFQRWIDISNSNYGITWTAIEAPIVEFGELSGNVLDGARQTWLWKREVKPTRTLYSWALNNHWNTNFPLQQSGVINFNYSILLHGAYDPVVSNRFGMEQHRPLIAVAGRPLTAIVPCIDLDNPLIILSDFKKSDDGKELVVRLRSLSDKEEQVKLNWKGRPPQNIMIDSPEGQKTGNANDKITLLPYGCITLRMAV